MASIRKLSRDKGKKNKPYYIQYFDADGNRVTAKGFTDKALTEQLAAKGMQVAAPSAQLKADLAKVGEIMTAEWVKTAGAVGDTVLRDYRASH